MKTSKKISLAVGALIVAASLDAYSQTSASAPAVTAKAASATSEPAPAKSNRALRRSVYSAIVKHKEINAGNISVTAKNGAVTLNGTVTDSAQMEKVAEIAKGVPGVISVANKLAVKKPFGGAM
jgi:hyperosmotically inducible periplasmic protein